MKVAVYGIGNFGYAFLKHLDRKNKGSFELFAYDYKPERIEYLTEHRNHPILHRDVKLSNDITFTNDIRSLLNDTDIVLLAVPSPATREALSNIKDLAKDNVIIVNTAKSLDSRTGERPSEVVEQELSDKPHRYALLAGGTIASDLFEHEPLGADIACTDASALEELVNLFDSHNLYIYPTADIIGVEYAAAFKNVISILAGMINGMGFSYGAETHVISRTAHKVSQICINRFNAKPETFSMASQSWGNDMWMSCTSNTRNRAYGKLVGSGLEPDEALDQMAQQNKLVEGHNTIKILSAIPEFNQISSLALLHEIIIEKTATTEDMRRYLLRDF